jgi:hypothetical protein
MEIAKIIASELTSVGKSRQLVSQKRHFRIYDFKERSKDIMFVKKKL